MNQNNGKDRYERTARKRDKQLGMSFGTARARLVKGILFNLLQRHGENICYRCEGTIETPGDLTIDHKRPWLGISSDLFWDMGNIAFAHPTCNARVGRRKTSNHGIADTYEHHGCRCAACTIAHRESARRYRGRIDRWQRHYGLTRRGRQIPAASTES